GCEMRRSSCSYYCARAIVRKPQPGANGFCAPSPGAPHKCKRYTACVANAVSSNTKFRGCQGMKIHGQCALATPLQTNFSLTFMAKCWLQRGRVIVPDSK